MKKKLISLGLAAIIASGCAKIPVVGNLYTEIYGKPGIGSYQYLDENKRNIVFTLNSFKYYYSGQKENIDIKRLSLDLEYAIKTGERKYDTLALTNIPFSAFTFGSGYTDKESFLEGRVKLPESIIANGKFNYYYFKISDKVLTSGEIK